jgi:putative membrane protein
MGNIIHFKAHPKSKANGKFEKPNQFHWICLGVLAFACAIATIHPLEMPAYLLHQLGTLLGVLLIVYFTYRGYISRSGFALAIGFLLVHVIGAHYLYSYVPYNDWCKSILHIDLNAQFGWTRNMYDRLVHLSYGFLLYKLLFDAFSVWLPHARRGQIALLVIQFVMASSMFYELIEWLVAIGMSPKDAENYNGQQGDVWDAHKDMATATLGAIMAWLTTVVVRLYTVK